MVNPINGVDVNDSLFMEGREKEGRDGDEEGKEGQWSGATGERERFELAKEGDGRERVCVRVCELVRYIPFRFACRYLR